MQVEGVEEDQMSLGEVIDVRRAFERAAHRPPRLPQIDRSRQRLITANLADLVEDRGVLIAEEIYPRRILESQHSPRRLRVREDVELHGRREADSSILIEK